VPPHYAFSMHRIPSDPRPGWQAVVREQAPDAVDRWDESACYVLSLPEVLRLEAATEELHRMCLQAARHVVQTQRYADFGIPDWAGPAIRRSLAAGAPSLYGCLDLGYDGVGPPKLLRYHADVPSGLLEAAVVQWYWLEQTRPEQDQWNQLHDRLVAAWYAIGSRATDKTVHCGWWEPDPTVDYLAETARQAGLSAYPLPMRSIGWDGSRFVDDRDEPIRTCVKRYPWAWMIHEPYGRLALAETTPVTWLEPAWKLLLDSAALGPLLWELHPGHPNLLPDPTPPPRVDDRYVVLSSWVVTGADLEGRAAGVGFWESPEPTIAGSARFVPHVVVR
jgi:glutathionylspermidine synthase